MKIIVTILSAVLLFSLSACGNSGGSTSQNQPQSYNTTKNTDNKTTSNSSNTDGSNGTTNQQDTATPKSQSDTNNIKNVKGFSPIEDQSFAVNLKAWGNVQFVSGKVTGGNHIPTVFYLTNGNGDIQYSFNDAPFPYNVDVKAVSFKDVNKDGLKDVIIIVSDNDNSGKPIAAVWLQKANKKFICDTKLSQEINGSGNNKDINAVMDYLSKNH